jgi:hypothetical protein
MSKAFNNIFRTEHLNLLNIIAVFFFHGKKYSQNVNPPVLLMETLKFDQIQFGSAPR